MWGGGGGGESLLVCPMYRLKQSRQFNRYTQLAKYLSSLFVNSLFILRLCCMELLVLKVIYRQHVLKGFITNAVSFPTYVKVNLCVLNCKLSLSLSHNTFFYFASCNVL